MDLPKISVSEQLAVAFCGMPPTLPDAVAGMCNAVLMDVAGLCVAARNSVICSRAAREPEPGVVHAHRPRRAASNRCDDRSLCNGTAAHGEDYDDLSRACPVHAGAVIIPAVIAAAEQHGLGQRRNAWHRGRL